MKLVGVTSCVIGIAHTYLAAEKLEKIFRKLGHKIKIERDGGMGPENELSQKEIDEADAVILAISGDLFMPERFEHCKGKTVKIDVQTALRYPEKVIELLKEKGLYSENG